MYRRDGVLHRAEQEPPAVDSGIDSDDSARELAVEIWRQQEYFHMMEQVDSSDDELGQENQALGSPKPSRNQDWEDPVLKQPGLYNKFLQSLKRRGICEDLALQQNWDKRKIYDDPMENMEEGRAGLVPMLRHGLQLDDGSSSTPESPDRSSPPLLEVELTASDEDEDSVLELVIPLQSAKGNRAHNPSGLLSHLSLFCTFFCCFRDLNLY